VVADGGRVRAASFPSFEKGAPPPARPAEPEPARPAAIDPEALRARARAEAVAAGMRQGHEAAYAESSGKLATLLASLENAARGLAACRVELAAEVERQLPRLLDVLVRQVLRHELGASDTAVRTVIRSLAERLAGCDRPVTVKVAPALVEALEAWRQSAGDGRPLAGVRIEGDPALAGSDFIIDVGDGFLDGRVESQLEAAWRLLEESAP
jgi:flagellar biosynthesis/type III secretory pathway protein FliH